MLIAALIVLGVIALAVIFWRRWVTGPTEVTEGEGLELWEILGAVEQARIVRILHPTASDRRYGLVVFERGELLLGLPNQSGVTEFRAIEWSEFVDVLAEHVLADDRYPLACGRQDFIDDVTGILRLTQGTTVRRLEWGTIRARYAQMTHQQHAELCSAQEG
jgi:hypothetical protein